MPTRGYSGFMRYFGVYEVARIMLKDHLMDCNVTWFIIILSVSLMYLCLSLKGSGHFISHWNLGKNYVVCVEIGYGISSFQQTRE